MANLAVGVFAKISPSVSFADSSLSDGAMQKIPLFALSRQRRYQTHDAPSRRRQHTCFAYVLIPAAPLYAGVQTMRARICSASSCDMFARVVWLKLWGVRKCRLSHLLRAARTCHAWLARLTRARGERFQRERKALFDDFCRAFGHSKAR